MRHRGPDDNGCWSDESGIIAFAHTRLSIQDLSAEGAQPMTSSSGRYVMTYNGEVYNFPELRKDLAVIGYRFKGHSDTEVILAAIEEWGLIDAVERFVGMFALALWDKHKRELFLVRDRIGIKPLYYQIANQTVVFGSELSAVKSADIGDFCVDPQALALYLRHNYVPAPYSIYSSVNKLPPGSILRARMGESGTVESSVHRYWSPASLVSGPLSAGDRSYSEVVDEIERRLEEAVRVRLVSDRPVGAFLSGGIDSSLVVALMQEHSGGVVQTFTIGFDEEGYDEAKWAAAVARHLGTDHHELYVAPSEARQIIPDLPGIFSEPFSDSSQIPTILVSRLARRNVIVTLSGDGGD